MSYHVSVSKHIGKPVLIVLDSQDKAKIHPLTKASCIQAGRDMFLAGQESWTNSSTVDFPQEIRPGFKHDIRELMNAGFVEELDKAEAPRKRAGAKAMAFRSLSNEFLHSLTKVERLAWEEIAREHKRSESAAE